MKKSFFSCGLRDFISHCVGRSVGLLVGRSVPPLRFQCFRHFASGLFITAPALSHATDAVVYTGPPTAPALHITAPAQHPRLQPVRVSGLVIKTISSPFFLFSSPLLELFTSFFFPFFLLPSLFLLCHPFTLTSAGIRIVDITPNRVP